MKTSMRDDKDSLYLESPFELDLTSKGEFFIEQITVNTMPTVLESIPVATVKNNGVSTVIIKPQEA